MPEIKSLYLCSVCKKEFRQRTSAEDCELGHNNDLTFENVTCFKDIIDQLFAKLKLEEVEYKITSNGAWSYWIEFPEKLPRLKKFNFPSWLSVSEVQRCIMVNVDQLRRLLPCIDRELREYKQLNDDVLEAQKRRDSEYWECNKNVRQKLKADPHFIKLQSELDYITKMMQEIRRKFAEEESENISDEVMVKYANLTKQLDGIKRSWRINAK